MFSIHICRKCAFCGVASLPSVRFLKGRCHTLPRGLQTFNMAEADTKVRTHVSPDPSKIA